MCQKILLVSRHDFLDPQIWGLEKIHGKSVIIHNENMRFEGGSHILNFHEQKIREGYDWLYYVINAKLQRILLEHNLPFGVLEPPTKQNGSLVIKITHRIPINSIEEKYRKKYERRGDLGYHRPQRVHQHQR